MFFTIRSSYGSAIKDSTFGDSVPYTIQPPGSSRRAYGNAKFSPPAAPTWQRVHCGGEGNLASRSQPSNNECDVSLWSVPQSVKMRKTPPYTA